MADNNNNDAQNQTNDLLKQLIEEQKKSNKPEPPPPAPPEPEQEDPRYDGVLSSLLATFQDNFDFVRSSNAEEVLARRQARAEKRREAASGDNKKGLRERMSDTMKDAKKTGADVKDNLKGIGKFITKGLGIAIIAPIIIDFINGAVDGVIEEAFGKDAADKYGGMIKVGGILAVIGGLLFGPMAILPLFFAGVMGVLGKKLVDSISDETLEKFGIDKGTLGGVVAAVGAALGLFVPMLLKKAITGTAKLALKMVTGGAALAGNLVKSVVKGPRPTPTPTAGSGGSGGRPPPVRPGGVPSGMRVNKAGRMIHANTGRFASADDIAKAMKLEGRASQVAKYMKFFKFAGPAMAIVPALIDPLLAIYNDAGPDEIKKQLAGALGTVGGVALGGLAGTALGTGIFPGVGSAIGGFLGMGLGAYLGEDLAEKIADAVLSGDDVDPSIVSKQQQRRQNRSQSKASGATPSSIKVADTNANISLPSSNAKIAPTGGETASAKVATLENGTQVVLAGGNGGNTTNVAKGGDTLNSTNVGGSNTTFNIVNNGARSLSNSHLPVSQSA